MTDAQGDQRAIPAYLMRGGTSKGLYFLAEHLPQDRKQRDRVLLAAMGSPDVRQIDGVGGAHPLTSKIAVVSKSSRDDADVDYLFLQVAVDKAEVSDTQNCGNILAGIGPFAIETGLVAAGDGVTDVRIHMVNTGALAKARVLTPNRRVIYHGEARIDGVPGSHAPVMLDFLDVAGSSCGALLPTGHVIDEIDGVKVTLIDNGMPVVVMKAGDMGLSGYESPAEIEANASVRARVEAIRLKAGPMMNLGDVTRESVPKMTLIAPAQHGGDVATRTFIPHRVHEAIGVLGAVSVATACALKGSVADSGLVMTGSKTFQIEHPTGFFSVEMQVEGEGKQLKVARSALLRTARLLMRGEVLVDASLPEGTPD
ncbi:MAG: 4-oxalomesaconate tautomerase [Hyphomicrobiales bacterium]|nr:4-oxalomesaconate tautomerase [Hyphomicrobiales bacterium]